MNWRAGLSLLVLVVLWPVSIAPASSEGSGPDTAAVIAGEADFCQSVGRPRKHPEDAPKVEPLEEVTGRLGPDGLKRELEAAKEREGKKKGVTRGQKRH